MAHLTIELILWLLLAFFIGGIIGFLLRWLFSAEPAASTVTTAGATTLAGPTGTAAAPAAPRATQPDIDAEPNPEATLISTETKAPARPLAAALPPVPKVAPLPVAPRAIQSDVKADPKPPVTRATAETPAPARPMPVASPAATAKPKSAVESTTATAKAPTAKTIPAKPKRPKATGKPKRPRGMAKARRGKADDLQQISGIGPKLEKTLQGLGFFHFNQIADWNSDEVMWVDDHLRFKGRIMRDEWIPQAKLLAAGNLDKFAKLYGTGGVQNAKGQTKSGSRTRRSK